MRYRLPRLTRRAFRDLALWMLAFGLAVGLAFPVFSVLLGVPATLARRPMYVTSCVGAGLLVGGVNYALARAVVGTRVRQLAAGMATVRRQLAHAVDTGDSSGCDPADCYLPVDSTDELGTVAESFNRLVEAVARAHAVERAIAAASTAVARHVDAGEIAAAALQVVVEATGARGGAVLRRGTGRVEVLARRGPAPPAAGAPGVTVTRLRSGAGVRGHLVLDLGAPAPPGLQRLLTALGDTLAVALENAELHARVREQACMDDLTGLANRRTGLTRLSEELGRAAVTRGAVGVLLVDVDHFKAVNDTFGHQVGDDVLRHLAAVAVAELRPGDLLCRYGGEELLAVLPRASEADVEAVAERLRSAVARAPLTHPVATVSVTVSVGAVSSGPGGADLATLVARADAALYAAKAAGRDCVRTAGVAAVTPERTSA